MASGDDNFDFDDEELHRYDSARDLYAILHVSKDVWLEN